MKIKLLKDIPQYKAGSICEDVKNLAFGYYYKQLVEEGFAEEIKDDIDMEKIRKYNSIYFPALGNSITQIEAEWFTAYRIVKAVMDKLNGDWKPNWEDENTEKYTILYNYDVKSFKTDYNYYRKYLILPSCKDEETAEKVISLCEPELKVLFNIK